MWLCHKQDDKGKKDSPSKGNSDNATVEDHVRLCEQVEKAIKGAKK